MIIATITSKNGIKIRLTDERWKHIVLMHPNLTDKQRKVLSTVKNPDYILRGSGDEKLAVLEISKNLSILRKNIYYILNYLVVVYKETTKDGFIITAYESSDPKWLFKKETIWSKHL